jgi:3,4-dihydroxy 2-butanone 4-phosphate synthase/GTP cyclohydrolase II
MVIQSAELWFFACLNCNKLSPLHVCTGGVLKRAGHTEAAVDLAVMAGFAPAGVLCELINKDGSMSRLPELKEFAKAHNLPLISIADLIR